MLSLVFSTTKFNFLGESTSEEDLRREVLRKIFVDLPGTPPSLDRILNTPPWNPQTDAIHDKRIQLMGYDTCRRVAIEFMKNAARETTSDASPVMIQPNQSNFQLATYSRNEPRLAQCKTGLLAGSHRRDAGEISDRMLKTLDLHLARKQTDYTAKLMRSEL